MNKAISLNLINLSIKSLKSNLMPSKNQQELNLRKTKKCTECLKSASCVQCFMVYGYQRKCIDDWNTGNAIQKIINHLFSEIEYLQN